MENNSLADSWELRLRDAVNASDVVELGFLLAANLKSQVTKSILMTAAVSVNPFAEVILELLLGHPTLEYKLALELLCYQGRLRSVQIFLDTLENLVIDDICGIWAIRSANLQLLQVLLQDSRLVVCMPTTWIVAAIECSEELMLPTLRQDSRFLYVSVECLNIAIKLHRRSALKQLLGEFESSKVGLIADSVISYCIDNGDPKTLELLLSDSRFYPSQATQSMCTSRSKEQFFNVLIHMVTSKDLKKLLIRCLNMDLQDNIRSIHASHRILFQTKFLTNLIKRKNWKLVRVLINHPYNIPVCDSEICICRVGIFTGADTLVKDMMAKNTCIHSHECLELCIDYGLQQAAVYLIHTADVINTQLITKAIFKNNITIAEAILCKTQKVDYECLLTLIENSKFLGMVELICSIIELDLSWNNYAMVKLAAKQNNTTALNYLLKNQTRNM